MTYGQRYKHCNKIPIICTVVSGTYDNGEYIFLKFSLASNTITSKVVHNNYKDASDMVLSRVTIYGVEKGPQSVTVNGNAAHYSYVAAVKVSVSK